MLRSIQKLIGDKRKQLIFPIFLMSLDAIGSLVMYLMLYFTVIHLLNGSLTGGLVRNYTIVCLISIILRLIIYRSGYFLCFSRGAEMCSGLRLDLANHYRSLSLGYFNQNSSGYLLSKCKNYPLGNTDRNHNILNCICRRMDWTLFRKSVRKPGRNIRRCDFNFNRGTDFYYGLTEKNWRNLRNEKIK